MTCFRVNVGPDPRPGPAIPGPAGRLVPGMPSVTAPAGPAPYGHPDRPARRPVTED